MAQNKTTIELENLVEEAFSKHESFCFETNFHVYPENWIQRAKSLGYELKVFFFCLETIELAKQRVEIRTRNEGHFVSDGIIEEKWKAGYKNINNHYSDFDYVVFIDNSGEQKPTVIFEMKRINLNEFQIQKFVDTLPDYTERRLPSIFGVLD